MQAKEIYCHNCGEKLIVSVRAFSINCPYCYLRVEVADHVIDGHRIVNRIVTSGSLTVEDKGELEAGVRAQNMRVEGKVHGDVRACDKITVTQSGRLCGDITASRLEVESGALLKGFCRIEP